MTKENQMDDLMQIAIEVGLIGKEPNGFDRVKLTKAEVRFAQLVTKKAVEAERESCVRDADDQWVKDPHISGGDAIRKRR